MSEANSFDIRSKGHLQVGQTDGEHIGCYLFGIESKTMPPSYHSVAITKAELIEDCREFFTTVANNAQESQRKSDRPWNYDRTLRVTASTLANLEMFIDMYFASEMKKPFLEIPGLTVFLRKGVRVRQKFRGEYIE